MLSLNARLLLAASGVLVAFLGLTGLSLDRAFRESALAAVRDRLQAQVYMLLGAADFDQSGQLTLPKALPEARFSTLNSGLYAQVADNKGTVLWRSRSMLGTSLRLFPVFLSPGESSFQQLNPLHTEPLFLLNFTVGWEIGPGTYRRYTFQVAENRSGFDAQVTGFRHSLWGWLLVSALVLLLMQGFILRWSLWPLRQVAREVTEIEAGRQMELKGGYPRELQPLTDNLNALILQSHARLERYRNALGDLAHSLKTPLAVLRGAVEDETVATQLRYTVQEQLERMNRTVEYQLQRAAASGRIALAVPVTVEVCARKVVDALTKVYADKKLTFRLQLDSSAVFYGEEGDLMEILGNLTDNACKWAKGRVAVRAQDTRTLRQTHLILEVEDDGPGIPVDKRRAILERGERADPNTVGYGIGLAVVRGIVGEVYQGHLEIAQGLWGGALVRVHLKF
jgi:two-component system sensor histidine kinase PhoQ